MSDLPKTSWATTADAASIAYQVVGGSGQTIVVIHPWASHLEVYLVDRGEHRLRGVPEKWRVYAVAS